MCLGDMVDMALDTERMSGTAVFLILTNGMRDHTLHINYTPQNAKLLKAAIYKQFKKRN